MAVTQAHVLDALRRIKGPDLDGNIVDLGLVSEVLIKDGRVYFSITVDPDAGRRTRAAAQGRRDGGRRTRRRRRASPPC